MILREPRPQSRQSSGHGPAVVVIPTYNERENLVPLVERIHEQDPEMHVLIVDDNSPDGTGAIADRLALADDRVSVIHREGKAGLGTAYLAGFRQVLAGSYEFILQMDADFSHRAEDLPALLAAAADADIAIGSRSVHGGRAVARSPLRRLVSAAGSLYARVVLGIPVRDCTGGFKCFRREALLRLDLAAIRSHGYAFQVEVNHLCHRAGLRLVEVPIVFPDRAAGRSKMTAAIFLEAWTVVLRLRLEAIAGWLRGAGGRPTAPSDLTG